MENTLYNLDLFCQGINNNGNYTFYHWIALYNDTPFAFIITSPVNESQDVNYNKWCKDGKKTFSMDLLIGAKEFLGKGLAHIMIQKFILTHYADADFFIIDPETINTKAIHVYTKAGFKKMEIFYPSFNPKPHMMMRLCVKELKNKI